MKPGDLILINWWHIKLKCYVQIPAIFVSRNLDLDNPEKFLYTLLVNPPDNYTNNFFFHQTYLEYVSCHSSLS